MGNEASKAPPTPTCICRVSSLCGRWEGIYTSRDNGETYWKELVLNFKLRTATTGTIIGHGVSLWSNMRTEFDVRGEFDWETKEVKLTTRLPVLQLDLQQYSVHFVDVVDGKIYGFSNGGLLDLWRCSPDADKCPNELLSGVWVDESISRSNDPTTWTETQVEFKLGPGGRHGIIKGKSMSLWRSMRIECSVDGTFDWETLEVSLFKRHICGPKNAVEYSGVILPDRRAIKGHYQHRTREGPISLRKIDGLHSGATGQSEGKTRSPEEQAECEKIRAQNNKERDEIDAEARKRAEDAHMKIAENSRGESKLCNGDTVESVGAARDTIGDTVKRVALALTEEDGLVDDVRENMTDTGIELAAELVTKMVKGGCKSMLEHTPALGWSHDSLAAASAVGGAVLLACPKLWPLFPLFTFKVLCGVTRDHYGNKWRASHNKWWSNLGEMVLGNQRVTRLMVKEMQMEPFSSMLSLWTQGMLAIANNIDAKHLVEKGVLDDKYHSFTHLKQACGKAMSYLHNKASKDPMSCIMAACVIMNVDFLCNRRALHSKAIVTFKKLMEKETMKSLITQAPAESSKDDLAPLGQLISFVRETITMIRMYDDDVGIPDYEMYRRRPNLKADGARRYRKYVNPHVLNENASIEEIKKADRLDFARELCAGSEIKILPQITDNIIQKLKQNDNKSWEEIVELRRLRRIEELGIDDKKLSNGQIRARQFQRDMENIIYKILEEKREVLEAADGKSKEGGDSEPMSIGNLVKVYQRFAQSKPKSGILAIIGLTCDKQRQADLKKERDLLSWHGTDVGMCMSLLEGMIKLTEGAFWPSEIACSEKHLEEVIRCVLICRKSGQILVLRYLSLLREKGDQKMRKMIKKAVGDLKDFWNIMLQALAKPFTVRIPEECKTIREAVNCAEFSSGRITTIHLAKSIHTVEGVFEYCRGDLKNTLSLSCEHLSFVGQGEEETFVDGGFVVECGRRASFKGLTIKNSSGYGLIVIGSGTEVTLRKVTVKCCELTGVVVRDGAKLDARECHFCQNHYSGVYVKGNYIDNLNTSASLTNCAFTHNKYHGVCADGDAVVDVMGEGTFMH